MDNQRASKVKTPGSSLWHFPWHPEWSNKERMEQQFAKPVIDRFTDGETKKSDLPDVMNKKVQKQLLLDLSHFVIAPASFSNPSIS